MKESKVVEKVKKLFKSVFKKPDINKIHVSPIHNRGFPDLLIVTEFGAFFIEVKAPGKNLTLLQKTKLLEIKKAGGESVYCYLATCDSVGNLLFKNPETEEIVCEVKC